MKYINYLFLLFPITTICEKTIRNINIPSCKKCIHFIHKNIRKRNIVVEGIKE